MTPKEKAKELIDKFLVAYDNEPIAIKSALIAVEEIKEVVSLCIPYKDEKSYIDYWQQVKHEINNL